MQQDFERSLAVTSTPHTTCRKVTSSVCVRIANLIQSFQVCKLLWPALRAHAGYRKTKRRDSQDILGSGARSVRTTESQGKLVSFESQGILAPLLAAALCRRRLLD
ncbi:uncharacterized protein AtWU_03144 [Aspergillus tubingensis]|uniref:uncharacterized protein n=1 Tax=Aspergillus tubingensis TaxID=5068 RepID=UPI0015789EEA|nr:uncharacterized protein AtWU_03144 [Aspergillus tubingensis]GFN13346.1 hypothetical protein AtWU_03144 [Aspergillus tubingensis]